MRHQRDPEPGQHQQDWIRNIQPFRHAREQRDDDQKEKAERLKGMGIQVSALRRVGKYRYAEKLDPQPQLFVEFGLMKLKPCRINVSSKSSTMPAR